MYFKGDNLHSDQFYAGCWSLSGVVNHYLTSVDWSKLFVDDTCTCRPTCTINVGPAVYYYTGLIRAMTASLTRRFPLSMIYSHDRHLKSGPYGVVGPAADIQS